MKTKITCIALAIIICLSAAFSIFVCAQNDEISLEIEAFNLAFKDSVYIKYAVSGSESNDTKLLVWTAPNTTYEFGSENYVLESNGTSEVNGKNCLIFDFTKYTAKQMTDNVYARAYVEKNGKKYYSTVVKYSVLQYVYNKLGKTAEATSDEKLKSLLVKMTEYGAEAQKYFDYKTDRLATMNFYQVKTENGTLAEDSSTAGLFVVGEKVKLNADSNDKYDFDHWETSDGTLIGTSKQIEVTVPDKNETYRAIYASKGFEFDSNGDGTCCLVGVGDNDDEEVYIPSKSGDGDTVTEIDASVFSGSSIKIIHIPATIEAIGRRAFQNCNSLTDVYYSGTTDMWKEVSVSSGNDCLLDANIHCNDPAKATYTVTFKDWDGTTLKTETVEEGKSATAPSDPEREGYTFIGWDKTFDTVTENIVVTATYKSNSTVPTMNVSNITASAGDTDVVITVSLENNPGFLTMALNMEFESGFLTLTKVNNGADYTDYNFTAPKNKISGCTAAWFASDLPGEIVDGDVMTLQFAIASNAPKGRYPITISCPDDGSTVDGNKQAFTMENAVGYITVE